MRRFFIGLAAGSVAAYTLVRTAQALRELRRPSAALERAVAAIPKVNETISII